MSSGHRLQLGLRGCLASFLSSAAPRKAKRIGAEPPFLLVQLFFGKEKVYLIRFAPPAFVPHRRIRSSCAPSPQVVRSGLSDFTPTPNVLATSPGPKPGRIPRTPDRQRPDFTGNAPGRLRTL